MFDYTKVILRWLGKWTLAGILTGLFLICLFPPIYGWLTGHIFGGLLSGFLLRHPAALNLLEHFLRLSYTMLALGGLDFLFLLMIYATINRLFKRNGTWQDIAREAAHSLGSLLLVQLVVGGICVLLFAHHKQLAIFTLIPPLLTQDLWACAYMMVWEMSLLLFALGYALTQDILKAWMAAADIAAHYFIATLILTGACIVVTWLPAMCLVPLHAPGWLMVSFGMTFHTLLISGLLFALLKQPDMIALFSPEKEEPAHTMTRPRPKAGPRISRKF